MALFINIQYERYNKQVLIQCSVMLEKKNEQFKDKYVTKNQQYDLNSFAYFEAFNVKLKYKSETRFKVTVI